MRNVATFSEITGVIIADDDPMIRSVLRSKLVAIGVNVFVTSDGLEAIAIASRIQAALILLDIRMPRLNGLLACQRIRNLPGNAQTPIVMLTSSLGRDAEAATVDVGATAYFAKPFRPALLLQAVAQFLPIDDLARTLIQQSADRVNRIMQPGSGPASPATSPKKARPDNLLDRNKRILDVLRH